MIDQEGGSIIFSSKDLRDGYWRVALGMTNRYFTTAKTVGCLCITLGGHWTDECRLFFSES